MDAHAHYRRATELAAQAERLAEVATSDAVHGPVQEGALRRADLLTRQSEVRVRLAELSYMRAAADPLGQMAADAKKAPLLSVPMRADLKKSGASTVGRIEWPPGGES